MQNDELARLRASLGDENSELYELREEVSRLKHEYDAEKSVLYEKEVELIQIKEGKVGCEH